MSGKAFLFLDKNHSDVLRFAALQLQKIVNVNCSFRVHWPGICKKGTVYRVRQEL